MPNQIYLNLLNEMKEIHEKKSHDYAKDSDYYSNFKEAAQFAGVTVEQVFLVMLGIKASRFRNLTENGKVPNNEGIEDTLKDLTVYCALLTSYRLSKQVVDKPFDYDRVRMCQCKHLESAHHGTMQGSCIMSCGCLKFRLIN
jgi:hypothetical protein